MRLIYLTLIATIACMALLASCASQPPLINKPSFVDPDRFAGDWYVISNIPYFGERNKVDSKTTYRRSGSNTFDDIFEARDGGFDSKVTTLVGKAKSLNDRNTRWQSTFYWVMRFKYEVLDVDDDYQIMVLGHKSRNYGWVMARNKQVSATDYQSAMRVFSDNGYDIARFQKVPQLPSDVGKPGFQLVSNRVKNL